MDKIIDGFYHVQEERGEFEHLEAVLSKKCEGQLKPFRQQLPPPEYEKMRDAAFSLAYYAGKSAFKIGFKTAVQLFLECGKEE